MAWATACCSTDDKLLANARAVQLATTSRWPTPRRRWRRGTCSTRPANAVPLCPHFSVEMETGTGKTYVYLRTIFELLAVRASEVHHRGAERGDPRGRAQEYRDHRRPLPRALQQPALRALCLRRQEGQPPAAVRHGNTLQILVINIDAFRKNFTGTEAEQKSNVIYKESDKLSGRQPIEFVQAARPIVIIDEPQSVDSTDKAQEAIKALNPLCTLRYSATHRNPYNLVYRLDPVRAFELQASQADRGGERRSRGRGQRRLRSRRADRLQEGIKAKLRIHVQTADGPEGEVGHGQEGRRPVRAVQRAGQLRRGLRRGRDQRRAGQRIRPLQQWPHAAAGRGDRAACARTCGGHRSSTRSSATWTRNCSCAAAASRCCAVLHRPRGQLPRLRRGRASR